MMVNNQDITAIQLTGMFSNISIINIYNDCTHQRKIQELCMYMEANTTAMMPKDRDHMIWGGDFNRHHPLWEEERNNHLFTTKALEELQLLIELLADYNMEMSLPKGIPTLQHMVLKNWSQPDNVWCTNHISRLFTTCNVKPQCRGPCTNHLPIKYTVDHPLSLHDQPTRYNFQMMEWKDFWDDLTTRMRDLPGAQQINTREELQSVVEALTDILQDIIRTTVPTTKPCPHSK